MAEAIFKKLSKDGFAESAGVNAGDEIDRKAVEILREFGYEVKSKKPRNISEVNLRDFDLVVTVCEETKCILINHPNVERWFIEDPKGKSREDYIKTLKIIEGKVRELLKIEV